MINNELLTFIKERMAQGSTKEQITDMLVTHGGWDGADVEEAFDTMDIASSSMKSAITMAENNPPTAIEKKIEVTDIKPVAVSEPNIITPNLMPVEVVKPTEVKTPVSVAPAISVTPTTSATIPPFLSGEIKKVEPEIRIEPVQSTIVSATTVFPSSNFQKPSSGSVVHPATASPVMPKVAMPASPVYESPGFFTAPKPEITKTLEPTGTPSFASARLGTFRPKPNVTTDASISDPFHQRKEPSIPEISNEKETKSPGAFSLGNLRAKFSGEKKEMATAAPTIQAKVESSATPKISSFSPFPSSDKKASEKIAEFGSAMKPVEPQGVSNIKPPVVNSIETPVIKTASPFGSPSSDLSPHLQSGMTPTPGVGVFPSFGVKKPTEPSSGASAFTTNQKLPRAVPMPIQHSLIKRTDSSKGRKLLGTIMFLMGFVFGATGMHAYLNEYLNPIIDWTQTNISALSQTN